MNLANLQSLAKIGIATFAGAFFGALTLTSLPTTLDQWKAVLAPALGAAIAAEVVFLRAQLAAFLVSANAVSQTPAAAAQPAAIAKAAASTLPVALLATLLCAGCNPATTQTTLNTIPGDITLVVCAINTFTVDEKAGMSPTAIVADEIKTCGADVASILTVIDEQIVQQATAGAITPTAADAKLVAYHSAFNVSPPKTRLVDLTLPWAAVVRP